MFMPPGDGAKRGRLELSPMRSTLAATGWFMLLSHGAGLLVTLPSDPRPAVTLGLFAANALLFGVLSLVGWRYALKRVVSPLPSGAVVVPERVATRRQVTSVLLGMVIVALAVTRVLTPAVLGIGFGGALGLLSGARKVKQFERDDGRQVLRKAGWRAGDLYAAPQDDIPE
jgi:hypothetical protein